MPLHFLISKIFRRSKRFSPIKLALASSNSPTAVDEQSQSPTSHAVDVSVYDVSYDSDTEIEFTRTSHSSCTSCDQGVSEKTGFVFFVYLKEKLKTVFKPNHVYNRSAFYSS